MQTGLQSILQNVDWNGIISAAIFGTLGYLFKALVDYLRERAVKHAEVKSELSKRRNEKRQDDAILVIQALNDLKEPLERVFDLLDHAYKMASSLEDELKRADNNRRESYVLRSMPYTIGNLLARLQIANSAQLELIMDEIALTELRSLRKKLMQLFSDQDLFRDYQTEIARYISIDPRASTVFPKKPDQVSKEAHRMLLKWCDSITGDFVAAHRSVVQRDEENTLTRVKSFRERGIMPKGYLRLVGSELRVSDQTAEFVALTSAIYDLIEQQKAALLQIYKNQ